MGPDEAKGLSMQNYIWSENLNRKCFFEQSHLINSEMPYILAYQQPLSTIYMAHLFETDKVLTVNFHLFTWKSCP